MKKVILISQESREVRIAILENALLEEFYIERPEALKLYGNIYKGIVKAVLPGIGAAFVNIGTEKDGFLYLEEESLTDIDDVPNSFLGIPLVAKQKKTFNDEKMKVGQEVIVQVVKESIRNKGPRLTRRISTPARYVVMIPGGKMVGISRRLENQKERERIKRILKEINIPSDAGFIVRTAGGGKSKQEFIRDIKYLTQKWKQIRHEIRRKKAPSLIYQELGLIERIIRDNFTEDTAEIVVDRKDIQKKVHKFLRTYLPRYKGGVKLVQGKESLFDKYNIEKEIERTFRRKVTLQCGGHVVIEQTEGLVSIDVNSGKFTGVSNLEETAFRTNCDAAREIARQIRLRDMGGIIIIDFIDMDKYENRKKVFRVLEESVKRDRAKTNILQISKLGLVEMTRQRMRPSLESAVYEMCPYCEGRGVVKSVITMSIKAIREIRKALVSKGRKKVEVKVHPRVAERLINQEKKVLKAIEWEYKSKILILSQPQMHIEDINISL
ncbi:MAG: Rne/Rng family ribonuclease [Candidatus Omnitrophica bacterium]|nr:Rne/Rng family ribonuclease [Candidatus Omnitrophota bacterium]